MADGLNIVVKALLDEKDLRAQTEAIKDVTIHGKIVIDKADLKKQIDSIAGESSKFGNKFKIKYGVDKGDFVKQFRVAGEEAKKEVEKALSKTGAKMPVSISQSGVDALTSRLKGLKLDDDAIEKATASLAQQNIQVNKITESFKRQGESQDKIARLVISGTDELGRQVNVIQQFDVGRKKYLNTETQITSKLNEQGQIVTKMATDLRSKDLGTIKSVKSNELDAFVQKIQNAALFTDEMKRATDDLRVSLNTTFSKEGMTSFLNQFDIVKARFKTLQEEAKAPKPPVAKQDPMLANITDTTKAIKTTQLDVFIKKLQEAGIYTGKMEDETNNLKKSLSELSNKRDLSAYNDQFKSALETSRLLAIEQKKVSEESKKSAAEQKKLADEVKKAGIEAEKARAPYDAKMATIDTNTAKLSTSLSYQGMDAQTAGISNLRNEINSLISEYGRLKVSMDGLDPNSAEFQALGVQVDALDSRFKSATKAAELFNGSFSNKTKLAGIDDQIRKAKSSLEELELKWSKFKGNPALLTEFKELQAAAQQLDATNLQNFNKQLASFKTNVRAAGADTRSFGDELKNALAKFGLWITASSIFMQAWRGMRQMVDSVKELDAALVEFNKVADLSSSQLDKFVDRAFEAGEALGRTGTMVLEASARFKQAGYNVDESLALAQTSLMMMNVGDGIDTAERAASDLIAALKGFQLEVGQSQQVLDALNNTSNNTAIGFNNLSEGVSRIAGTLAQSGTTMQQTMGLLVGGFSSLRNIEKVSSGLVMLSQRMRAVTEDGEAIEGLAPKLESAFQEIVGVSIKGPDGELRSTYDLLSDLQKKWDSLTSSQQQYIGSLVSG